MSLQMPWAILLCRFNDDTNDPNTTRLSDIYRQWGNTQTPYWMSQNILPAAEVDNRTILDLYQTFFTITGLFTFNVVRYFDEMSHGWIDMSGNQVFPVVIDLTAAQGAALAANPGGTQYLNDMFARAKGLLKQQHGVDWLDFPGGVAISFQSPDYGSQGSTNYDGGPGVYADIRYVRNNGTQWWGHEMGHAFGLGHSRTDGEFTSACTGGAPEDYTDWWDIMSIRCAGSAQDESYGMRGPGMNAWNMRYLNWLNEGRIWKSLPNQDFTAGLILYPLHERNRGWNHQGLLGAELPGIGIDSNYLIEFRMPTAWDSAFPKPVIIVHRFVPPNSYIMKGTSGQKVLDVGDIFEVGNGPFSRLRVDEIDTANSRAMVTLCHSASAKKLPTIKIIGTTHIYGPQKGHNCHPDQIGGTKWYWFVLEVSGSCLAKHQVHWNVTGATPTVPLGSNGDQMYVTLPPPGTEIVVSATAIFDDGVTATDLVRFWTISQEEANWIAFLCTLLDERKLPNPWWQWAPTDIKSLVSAYSPSERKTILTRAEGLVQTLKRSLDAE